MVAPLPVHQGILALTSPVAFGKPASYTIPAVTAGSYLAEGLPNITGSTSAGRFGYVDDNDEVGEGALYRTKGTGDASSWNTSSRGIIIHLDASRSNSIYGNSDTVQPNSLTVRFYIKF